MNRRGFLSSIVAALAARYAPKPAFIRPLFSAPIRRPPVILTPSMITREALMLLEKNLAKITTAGRPKIGETLNLRIPPRFADIPRPISEQNHVDVTFSSGELTLSLEDFQERVLAPQIRRQLVNAAVPPANLRRNLAPGPL